MSDVDRNHITTMVGVLTDIPKSTLILKPFKLDLLDSKHSNKMMSNAKCEQQSRHEILNK